MANFPTPLRPLWPYAKRAYTMATRVAAPATMRLSRLRGGYLPRRIVGSAGEAIACSRRAGTACAVVPAMTLTRRPSPGMPTRHFRFEDNLRAELPAVGVSDLPGGRALCSRGVAIITGDGILVDELSPSHGTSRSTENPIFLRPFPPRPQVFDGTLGVLAGTSDNNYCHFLMDIFPRMSLIERCHQVPAPEKWYAPLELPFQRELLGVLGIDPIVVVDRSRVPHVQAAHLVVPGPPDPFLKAPQWTISYLRSRLRPGGLECVPGRRLFVPRSGRRNNRIIRNHDEVQGALVDRGFITIDPAAMSVADQVKAFAEAETIVATHGAALANLAFTSPGARVIEIFAPDLVAPCFWALSQRVPGLRYSYLVADGTRRPARVRAQMGLTSDLTVNVGLLMGLLDA